MIRRLFCGFREISGCQQTIILIYKDTVTFMVITRSSEKSLFEEIQINLFFICAFFFYFYNTAIDFTSGRALVIRPKQRPLLRCKRTVAIRLQYERVQSE